jgi:hypothetical protein
MHYTLDSTAFFPVKSGTYADFEYSAYTTLKGTDGKGKQIGFRLSGK